MYITLVIKGNITCALYPPPLKSKEYQPLYHKVCCFSKEYIRKGPGDDLVSWLFILVVKVTESKLGGELLVGNIW
jgi:hypothetical protein